MKPIRQNGEYDCFSACIASILETQLDHVPLFVSDAENWLDDARRWLRKRGWTLSPVLDTEQLDNRRNTIVATDPYEVDGVFAAHSVIARHGKVVHDPMRRKPKKRYEIVCGWELVRRDS
jgi:hypothetical protein